MSLDLVSCTNRAHVTATLPITHRCPFRDELDEGTVTVSWATTHHLTIELHSLAAFLAGFADLEISHEDITVRILDRLQSAAEGRAPFSVTDVEVSTRWNTAGAEVVVTSAVPRERVLGSGAGDRRRTGRVHPPGRLPLPRLRHRRRGAGVAAAVPGWCRVSSPAPEPSMPDADHQRAAALLRAAADALIDAGWDGSGCNVGYAADEFGACTPDDRDLIAAERILEAARRATEREPQDEDLRDLTAKSEWVATLWQDWQQWRRDGVRKLSPHLHDAIEDLAQHVAAERARRETGEALSAAVPPADADAAASASEPRRVADGRPGAPHGASQGEGSGR